MERKNACRLSNYGVGCSSIKSPKRQREISANEVTLTELLHFFGSLSCVSRNSLTEAISQINKKKKDNIATVILFMAHKNVKRFRQCCTV